MKKRSQFVADASEPTLESALPAAIEEARDGGLGNELKTSWADLEGFIKLLVSNQDLLKAMGEVQSFPSLAELARHIERGQPSVHRTVARLADYGVIKKAEQVDAGLKKEIGLAVKEITLTICLDEQKVKIVGVKR